MIRVISNAILLCRFNQPRWKQRPSRPIARLSIAIILLSSACMARSAEAYQLNTDVTFGGFFSNGGVYSFPPLLNLVAHPPVYTENKDRVGAYITNGSKVYFDATNSIDVRDNAIGETIGIMVGAGSHVSFPVGATLQAHEQSIGSSIGLIAEYDSTAAIAGSFQLTEDGNDGATGIISEDTSVVQFSGVATISEQGNDDAVGIVAQDSAFVRFSGTMTISEEGNGDAIPFQLRDSATLVSTGNFSALRRGNGTRRSALVSGQASAYLNGGSLSVQGDRPLRGDSIPVLELQDEAFGQVSGGTFEASASNRAFLPLFSVNDQAELRINGRGFNHPLGAISDADGEIIGTLADGRPIHIAFIRGVNAAIILVPEPTGMLLAIAGCLASAMLRVRTRKV